MPGAARLGAAGAAAWTRDKSGARGYHPAPPSPTLSVPPGRRLPVGDTFMTLVASLVLFALPQVFPGGDIHLPPKKPGAEAAVAPVRPLTEIERFKRDLAEMQGPEAKVEARLQDMAGAYAPAALETLMIETSRSARANEMQSLMVVVRRFAPASAKTMERVGEELLFQLLSRPLAEATRPVIETMAQLKGAAAKAALQQCIQSRIPGARRHAAEVIVPMLGTDDVPFAVQLTREQSLDLQMRGIDLLRALPDARSVQRLIELLSKEPTLAGAACSALIGLGQPAVANLQQVLASPFIDRGFAYAGFALAQIGAATGTSLLADASGAALAARLGDPDVLTRSLLAVPLSDLMFRDAKGLPSIDAAVVEALLDVVQPLKFVPNLELLRRPCEDRLQRATGRTLTAEAMPWRTWWADQKSGFAAVRARVAVDERNVGTATVTWRHEQRCVRVLAEGLADSVPQNGVVEIVVTKQRMQELVAALEAGGLYEAASMRVDSALPRMRSLQVQVPECRALVAMPLAEHAGFDALVALVQRTVDEEAWQLYRNAQAEPDRGAFWRAERRWREANPGELERGRRFLRRAIANWTVVSPALRARAIEHVMGHAQRKQLLSEADGENALAVLATLPELTEIDRRLLELAASAPGDRCWRAAVDLAVRAKNGGRAAVRSVFAVLGPEAVLQALQDVNPVVRRAGIEEVMVVRDLRAAPRLIELLADADLDVRTTAAAACGQLQLTAASKALVAIIVADDTVPGLRRECLRSLGRVGGEHAFEVLQKALLAKDLDDKEAAMRGLGDLRDPRAAHVLVDMVVLGHGKDLGTLARLYLARQSGKFAIPALQAQLELVREPAIRNDLVLMLGGYHDPAGLANLLDLLRDPKLAPAASQLIEGATGLSFADAQDRADLAESWYRKHRQEPQWRWLLEALRAADVPTSLRAEHFGSGEPSAVVPELVRLLVEARESRFWPLAAAVLRSTTGEDFGSVSQQSALDAREAIAARYRLLAESPRAAQGR